MYSLDQKRKKKWINVTYLVFRWHRAIRMRPVWMKMNTPSRWVRKRIKKKEKKRERKRDGGSRATWVDSVQLRYEERAIWKCALLNHRLTYRIAVVESIRFPTLWNIHLPCQLLCTFYRLDLLDASLFVSTISPSMFLSVSRLAVSSFYAEPTVFLLLPGSRRHPRDAMSRARGHKTRYCRPIDRYKGSVCTPWCSKYAQDITVERRSIERPRYRLSKANIHAIQLDK